MKGIYIVEFDTYPGLYKIGKSKNIEERVRQFQNSTILLGNVRLLYCKEFENYTKAERDIHALLKEYRCKENREFFKGDLEYFISTAESLNADNYSCVDKDKESRPIEVSDRALIYLLQLQIQQLTNRIVELEEKEKLNFACLRSILHLFKK